VTSLAILLVIASAFIHATWNLLAKRAGGGAAFVWLCTALASVIWAPMALWVLVFQRPHIGGPEAVALVGTAVLHLAYFLVLQKGYVQGDFSLVYPVARGTGPTLSMLAAIALLGESPTPLALLGGFLVVAGVFVVTGDPRKLTDGGARNGLVYGILTGVFIAAYTLWDKYAVSALHIPPLLLDYSANLGQTALLAPFALKNWEAVRQEWSNHRLESLGVAVMSSLAFIIVLTVLITAPVSYVAPMREISILIGTVMGARLFAEDGAARRLIGGCIMVVGVFALAVN
jgi:drug/metabolite transporter (DMT)-like permease